MTTAASGLMSLTGLREAAAAALAPQGPDDPPVLMAPVDSLEPPALMLAWDEPWLTFNTPCFWYARLAVSCWAGRLSPDAGIAALEELVTYVTARMRADAYPWPHEATRAPRMVEIGAVPLLMARVVYTAPVSLGGPA